MKLLPNEAQTLDGQPVILSFISLIASFYDINKLLHSRNHKMMQSMK